MEKDIKNGLGERLSDALVSSRLAEGLLVPAKFVISDSEEESDSSLADTLLANVKTKGLHQSLENLASGSLIDQNFLRD